MIAFRVTLEIRIANQYLNTKMHEVEVRRAIYIAYTQRDAAINLLMFVRPKSHSPVFQTVPWQRGRSSYAGSRSC